MRASFSDHREYDNGWKWLLALYSEQKALGELGITTPVHEFDDVILDGFLVISNKINEIQTERMKNGKK